MIVISDAIIPTKREIPSIEKTERVQTRVKSHGGSEILRRHDGISGVIKGGPDGGCGVGEDEFAGVI